MTYLKRTNVNAHRSRITALFIAIAIFVLFSVQYVFPNFYAGIFYPVTTFFWKSESGILGFMGNAAHLVFSKYSLVKENQRLLSEVASRDTSILLLDSLKDENESLKSTLGRISKGNDALGIILARPPVLLYDTLIIDIGRTDGVQVGNKVYTDGDNLIGDISEVYANQSKVSLFSNPGRLTSVLIGKTNISAQAKGRGLGNFTLELPVEIDIQEGDIIILPQIRPHTFGVVEKILVDSSDSLQTILFKSPTNISNLRFVQVDRSNK